MHFKGRKISKSTEAPGSTLNFKNSLREFCGSGNSIIWPFFLIFKNPDNQNKCNGRGGGGVAHVKRTDRHAWYGWSARNGFVTQRPRWPLKPVIEAPAEDRSWDAPTIPSARPNSVNYHEVTLKFIVRIMKQTYNREHIARSLFQVLQSPSLTFFFFFNNSLLCMLSRHSGI